MARCVPIALLFLSMGSWLCAADVVPIPPAGRLEVHRQADVITIQYGGRSGYIGIPSWRAVVRRDDGGNISSLHVPAHDPASLSSGRRSWPVTIVQTKNVANITGTMDKGRENYVGFRVDIFELVSESPDRIVLRVGGPSPTRHFLHERTYTFTPPGVQIEGWVEPLIDMRSVSFDPHWDRRQIAASHESHLPMRTQGEHGWRLMPSSGSDAAVTLPARVEFPLEAELRLRRDTPTFVRVFYDRVFESAEGKRQFIHNNKDQPEGTGRDVKLAYEKLSGIVGGPVPKGVRQNFAVRFVFETQDWPVPPAAVEASP